MLFALLRSALCGEALTDKERELYNAKILPKLVLLAKKHDVSHLLSLGLKNNGLLDENSKKLENEMFKAVYRYETQSYELKRLCEALEQSRIPFIPLKGSVIRNYYPKPWMRTSCDIDILVHEKDADKAVAVLTEQYGYEYHGKGSHDISLFASMHTHIELHYDLVEEGIANESSEVLKNVWDMSVVRDGYDFWYEMPDEYYYFYHIAHMAKHFENGGCGIRPFIDLWILDNIEEADKEKRDKLLNQGNLLKFAKAARKLSQIWLSYEQYDLISKQLEDYILRGGVYGNSENRITVQQQKKGGRISYALSKIFIPYEVIKFYYPILQKHRWLTPFMEVRRWCRLIFCGHAERTIRELRYNQSISADEADATKDLLLSIGL